MPKKSETPLASLPRVPETWVVGAKELRVWIDPPTGKPYRPFAILLVSAETGRVRLYDLSPTYPTDEQVRAAILKAMRQPPRELAKPARPARLVVPESRWARMLKDAFPQATFGIEIDQAPLSPDFYTFFREMEEQMNGRAEQSGLLSATGVTPELVGSFFSAAAEFFRAAPWVQLNNQQVLALRHPQERDYRYAIVMGNGGVEYGLLSYLTWAEVEQMFNADDAPRQRLPKGGWYSMYFDRIVQVPFDDLDALQKYGWEITAPTAYPIIYVIEANQRVRRPTRADLEWYEAALRAIPIFLDHYLKPKGFGEYVPVEATIPVSTHAGMIQMQVKYPAGRMALGDRSAQEYDWFEAEDEANALPAFDRRAMEGALREFAKEIGGERGPDDLPSAQAQELMYQAWEEPNPAKRIALAHDALVLSPECADAYVLLAEEEADSVNRALELYQQGVQAGERALGRKFFDERVGHFWGLLETRPYMRAREGLARMLWRLNQYDDAITHFRDMLRLNPGDNQGLRYLLMDLYLHTERDADAQALLKDYRDDISAMWMYARALLLFRKHGASVRANNALAQAREKNPFVPAYLAGAERLPARQPQYIGFGDENEAIWYAHEHLNYWRRTPGAVEWLRAQGRMKSVRTTRAKKKSPRSKNR